MNKSLSVEVNSNVVIYNPYITQLRVHWIFLSIIFGVEKITGCPAIREIKFIGLQIYDAETRVYWTFHTCNFPVH